MFRLITLFNVFFEKKEISVMLNENCFSGFVLPTLQITDNSEKWLREIVLTNFVAHIYKTIETISFNTKSVNSIINSKFTARQSVSFLCALVANWSTQNLCRVLSFCDHPLCVFLRFPPSSPGQTGG